MSATFSDSHVPKLGDVDLPSYDFLLSQLIACSSISSPLSEWDQSNLSVITCLEKWFSSLGFSCEVMEIEGQPGKFNLIATFGKGDGGLVLAGHTDTVPYDASKWRHDPFKMSYERERFYGLGTCDMKGFFPIIVEALRAMSGASVSHPLIVVATADEESSMSGVRALVGREQGLGRKVKPRAAVIGEPTSIKPIRMHKGIMMENIVVTGKSGHSSDPHLGNSALEAMHKVIGELLGYRDHLQSKYNNPLFKVSTPTMNLGHIHGGDSPNRICGHSQLSFDIRILPGMHSDEIRNELEQRLLESNQETGAQLTMSSLIDHVDPFETPADSELVRLSEELTGNDAEAVAFATEAPFLSKLGLDTIVMGAGSIDQAHQPNEYLESSQVKSMANVLQTLIKRYCLAQVG